MATDVSRVRIQNGRITGHHTGVEAARSNSVHIENVDFTACRAQGIASRHATSMTVRGCVFQSISGWSGDPYAIGIRHVGHNARIERSHFREIYRQPDVVGVGEGVAIILTQGTTNAVIRDNRFENSSVNGERDIAVWIAEGGMGHVLSDNAVVNFGRGFISASSEPSTITNNTLSMRAPELASNAIHLPAGFVRQNRIAGYQTPISGGAEQSDNVILP